MEKIREKNTAWLETIRNFFASNDEKDDKESEYENWKKENADLINQTYIKNLEKMMEHKEIRKRKPKDAPVMQQENVISDINQYSSRENNHKEGRGREE